MVATEVLGFGFIDKNLTGHASLIINGQGLFDDFTGLAKADQGPNAASTTLENPDTNAYWIGLLTTGPFKGPDPPGSLDRNRDHVTLEVKRERTGELLIMIKMI